MIRRLPYLVALAALVAAFALPAEPGRAGAGSGPPRPLIIGSKQFTESRLLAEMMAVLIESASDIPVERRLNLGGTTLVFTALRSGQIDLYPEYTGTAWAVLLERKERVTDPLRVYLEVARSSSRRWELAWLRPFGFSNSYALAMPEPLADELSIRRISDLAGHQEKLRAGVSLEFLNRGDGFPGLAEAYGLRLGELRGMEHGLAYEALAAGQIDLTDSYTTDGKLLRFPVRLLEDDLRFFPPYDAAPVVRRDALDRFPDLEEILGRLAFALDDDTMRRLNFRVEEEGGTYQEVARSFLQERGLLAGAAGLSNADSPRRQGLLGFLLSRRAETLRLTGQHLLLASVAVLLAIVVAVPLGILLARRNLLVQPVLGTAGVIQTIPGLALLAFMIPLPGLGLGSRSAVAALFLYALLPIIRNTFTGIREVDPELIEAARAMGLEEGQILRKIQLPLGIRTIMAGIRTSAVISIGVATLAAFIGAGGLGEPIITGLQLNDSRLILSGALPAALLALLTDLLLGLLEKALTPRGLAPGAG